MEDFNILTKIIDKKLDVNELDRQYPLLYQQLKEYFALCNKKGFVNESQSLANFFGIVKASCLKQKQSAQIKDLVEIYKKIVNTITIPESMSRYQSSLDNDLYKALRALKEAQAWRADRRLSDATSVN